MKRSPTKSSEAADLPLLLSREMISRLEELRSCYGKASIAAVLDDVIEMFERTRDDSESKRFADLPPRLQQVLRLIADGLSTKEIASRLSLSVRTVEKHRANIMEKIGVREVASLVRWCVQAGLVKS